MSELRFEKIKIIGAELGEESCVPDLLGEHILQNSLKFRLMRKTRSMRDTEGEKMLLSISAVQ